MARAISNSQGGTSFAFFVQVVLSLLVVLALLGGSVWAVGHYIEARDVAASRKHKVIWTIDAVIRNEFHNVPGPSGGIVPVYNLEFSCVERPGVTFKFTRHGGRLGPIKAGMRVELEFADNELKPDGLIDVDVPVG